MSYTVIAKLAPKVFTSEVLTKCGELGVKRTDLTLFELSDICQNIGEELGGDTVWLENVNGQLSTTYNSALVIAKETK